MTSVVVSLGLGWNSSTTGWGEGGWGNDVAIGTNATASVGSLVVTIDADVDVSGFGTTASLGIVFETQNGVFGTATLGSFFTTNTISGMTSSLGTASVTGDANTEVTGLAATASISSQGDRDWETNYLELPYQKHHSVFQKQFLN
jgi:hypothetical protein